MKPILDRSRPSNTYVSRQIRVRPEYPRPCAAFAWRVKVNDLTVGMNTRIRPACANSMDGMGRDPTKRLFQLRLNRPRATLSFPAREILAIVLELQSKPHAE